MSTVRARLAGAYSAWEGWWFTPREISTLAVIRILFGIVALLWTLSNIPTLLTFFGSHGIYPQTPDYSRVPNAFTTWSLLSVFPGNGVVVALLVVMVVASLSVTVGFFPRVGALLIFAGSISLERRNPFVYNAGDILIRVMALYLFLSPCGAALSLDRWRKHRDRFWEFPVVTQWAVRLMQLQVSFVYLNSVWSKVRGTTWNDGTAVSIALRLGDLQHLPVPHFLTSAAILANLETYGALATELSVGILIWNRRARPYVIVAGLALHLGIDWSLTVGFFSYMITMFYLAFADPPAMSRRILALRDKVVQRRLSKAAVS